MRDKKNVVLSRISRMDILRILSVLDFESALYRMNLD